mmetsp:Transcript_1937/g.5517  ORF Transcript_1937/g.5517 Transcript_1937/m.5517 type:complete len:98 (-) Transcript_1937:49-342(-)
MRVMLAAGMFRRLLPSSQFVRHRRRKTLEVMLTCSKPKLGNRGDVVRVAAGFARHRLLPNGEAVRTTKEAEVAAIRKEVDAEVREGRTPLESEEGSS